MSGMFWKKLTPDSTVWGREKGREFRQVNKSCAVLPAPGPENRFPFTSSIAVAAKKKPKNMCRSLPPLLLASTCLFGSISWFHHTQHLQDGHLEAVVKAVLQPTFYWNTWQKWAEGNKGCAGTCMSTHCHECTGVQILEDDWKRNDFYLTSSLALADGRGLEDK